MPIDESLLALALKSRTVNAILFDMDDVLCYLDDTKRIAYLHGLCGLSHAKIEHATWGCGFEDRTDAGQFTADEYLHHFGRQIGYPISLLEWCEYRKGGMTPIVEMLAFAESLVGTHKLGILTNNGLLLQREIDTLFPELRPIFGDNIFCSAQFRIRKPEPQIYLAACQALGSKPEETLFIDDRQVNIMGAIQAGLIAHHFVH